MLPVAVLAGGLATRLRPITETIPKSLVEINGEPFLAHQLRLLRRNGIRRVVMCVGFLGNAIERYAGAGAAFGLEIAYSYDGPSLRGTGGAIANALPVLGDRFFVLYGDSYLPCDYRAVERAFLATGSAALMTVYPNGDRWDASNVEFENCQIRAYSKSRRTPRMRHIDYGLGVFHASAFAGMSEPGNYDLSAVYERLLDQRRLAAFEVEERFYEIGSFQGIQDLEAYLARQEVATK
jgi:NDP-sugar pyrophosphorylase family protein